MERVNRDDWVSGGALLNAVDTIVETEIQLRKALERIQELEKQLKEVREEGVPI